jgi:hypothetical protein
VAAQHIEEVRIPAEEVLKIHVVASAGILYWILLGSSHEGAKLHLNVILHPIDRNLLFKHGAAAEGKHFYEVPTTYFRCHYIKMLMFFMLRFQMWYWRTRKIFNTGDTGRKCVQLDLWSMLGYMVCIARWSV